MTVLSESAARDYAMAAGFRGDNLDIMIAIAHAESGLDTHPPDNINHNPGQVDDGSRDRGIIQINSHWHPEVSDACAYEPLCAFKAGYKISNRGTNFHPWSTYNSGAYLPFYHKGGNTGGGGSTSGGTVELVRQSIVPKYTWFSGYGVPRANGRTHQGEDLGAAKGTRALFPENGTIWFPGGDDRLGHFDPLGGYVCYLAGDSGLYWYGAHFLKAHQFGLNQRVTKGSTWGLIDNSGDADGAQAHIHYQVTDDSSTWTGKDPAVILQNGIPGTNVGTGGGSGLGYVTLYSEANYSGSNVVIHGDTPSLADIPLGLPGSPNWNNRALSINIPSGTVVRLYENLMYAGGQYAGGVKYNADASIPDLSVLFPHGLSSIRYIKLGTGSGGGITGIGNNILQYLGQHVFLNSLAADVHKTISTIPGFSGIVLAIDEAEEVPGWIDHGTSGAGDIIRSISDTVFSNALGISVRFLITFIGFILMVGLLMNLVKSVTGVSTRDIATAAVL